MIFLPLLLLPFLAWAWPHLNPLQQLILVVGYVAIDLWWVGHCRRWIGRR